MIPRGWDRLRAYQKKLTKQLSRREIVGLWTCAGSGKTAMVLAALALSDIDDRILIVTRAIGRHVWERDAAWVIGPSLSFGVLREGRKEGDGVHDDPGGRRTYTSLDHLLAAANVCVVNYDILPKRGEELLGIEWKAMILDEAHAIKGGYQRPELKRDFTYARRTRYHWAKELAMDVQLRGGPVWQVTATPISNRRRDLWSQLDIALPGQIFARKKSAWGYLRQVNNTRAYYSLPPLIMSTCYESSKAVTAFPGPFGAPLIPPEVEVSLAASSSFLRRYCGAEQGTYGLVHDRETMSEELEQRLRLHFARLSRRDIAEELPAVQRIVEVVEPRKENVPSRYLGGGFESAIARTAWQKLPHGLDLAEAHLSQGEKVCIAVNRIELAFEVMSTFEQTTLPSLPAVVRRALVTDVVTGENYPDPIARARRVNEFNEMPNPGFLVVNIDAVSESINLHHVCVAIVLSLPYTPRVVAQFEGRFARLGGDPVTLYYLMADGTHDLILRDTLYSKLADTVRLHADTADASSTASALSLESCADEIIEAFQTFLQGVGDFEEDE